MLRHWMCGALLVVSTVGCGDPAPANCLSATSTAPAPPPPPPASAVVEPQTARSLTFKDGARVRVLTLAELGKAIAAEEVKQFDPYYGREKRFRGFPVEKVLTLAFPDRAETLHEPEYVVRATDGYTVPLRGAQIMEPGAFIAFEDLDFPAWEPIGQQRANPAPFYLVWSKKEQTNLETHPRPYQLATIEIARFEDVFPKTVPTDLPKNDSGWRGYAIFKNECIRCHAMNRQGGRVGPELNVPKSIVEYRPVDQIKAYIRNPLSFRYSTMPAHEKLTDEELDALVGYFTAMKQRKSDDGK